MRFSKLFPVCNSNLKQVSPSQVAGIIVAWLFCNAFFRVIWDTWMKKKLGLIGVGMWWNLYWIISGEIALPNYEMIRAGFRGLI